MKTYQIHLIRHGITEGNLLGQYIGSTDLPLCEQGITQLKQMKETYKYPGADAVLTSPMLRCTQTAEILYPESKPLVIEGLRECDFGELEGLTAEQLKNEKRFSEWISSGGKDAIFGGESGEHFAERICSSFEQVVGGLLKTGTTSAAIITHGGVISTLLSRYGLPQADPSAWYCEPGDGFSVRIHVNLWLNGQVMEVYSRLLER